MALTAAALDQLVHTGHDLTSASATAATASSASRHLPSVRASRTRCSCAGAAPLSAAPGRRRSTWYCAVRALCSNAERARLFPAAASVRPGHCRPAPALSRLGRARAARRRQSAWLSPRSGSLPVGLARGQHRHWRPTSSRARGAASCGSRSPEPRRADPPGVGGRLRVGGHDHGRDQLAPLGVRLPDDHGLPHPGAGLQHGRDLVGHHVLAAGVDHVVGPAADDQPAGRARPAQVGGDEPAAVAACPVRSGRSR